MILNKQILDTHNPLPVPLAYAPQCRTKSIHSNQHPLSAGQHPVSTIQQAERRTQHTKRSIRLLLLLCIGLSSLLCGCLSSRRVRSNEYLLYGQTFRGNRSVSTEELEALIPQKPNRKLLRLPITIPLWIYEAFSKRYNRDAALKELEAKTLKFEQKSQQLASDPKALKQLNRQFNREARRLRRYAEEGNRIMRNLGEPPSYFYPRDGDANAEKIRKYLYNNGFINATVTYSLDTLLRRQIQVNYQIDERKGFYVRHFSYEVEDPRIDSIIQATRHESFIKPGQLYDADNIFAERTRIEELLRNNGYYAFNRQYIPLPLELDTTITVSPDTTKKFFDLWMKVLNPPGQLAHPQYSIGQVQVTINNAEGGTTTRQVDSTSQSASAIRNGIRYFYSGRSYATKLLDTKIQLRPGHMYSQKEQTETQRQLFLLNQFKFVNVMFSDTTNRRLRTEITLLPLDKYEMTFEGGLFVLYQSQGGYPGPFGNVAFRVRNLFGGLETLETNFRYGIEAQTNLSSKPYMAQELALNSSLIFPQILFPGPYRFLFNNYNPRTQLGVGFTYTSRPDYLRQTLRSTMSYNWQLSSTKQFAFFIADINLIRASFAGRPDGESFRQYINAQAARGNRTLLNSFNPSFASNISFAYTYNTNVATVNRKTNFFRAAAESGGTTLNLFNNKTIQHWSDSSVTGLQFYKYLRLNIDYRRYLPVSPHTTLAFRINSGFLFGYGPNKTAPYERRFFVGGSSSIRGWIPRRLGPGSALPRTKDYDIYAPVFKDSLTRQQLDYRFEQPGDILLEGSAEFRHRLFHFGADINGALFVDAGNVWLLRPDANKPLATLKLNRLLTDIAVATGYGVRIDFSYFIIRFDFGLKVWDPARKYIDEESGQWIDERFLLPKFSLRRLSKGPNPLVVNFGIGYPF